MTTTVLVIDGWLPERLNALLRMHWSRRHRRQRHASLLLGFTRAEAGIPWGCECRRRVSVTYRQASGPPADPDARWKQLLDALVEAGLLRDDSPEWCELGKVETVRGPMRTTITLEDL